MSGDKKFRELNSMADGHGVVLFGSDFLADLPVCELAQSFHIWERLYNRSVKGADIVKAGELLEECVFALHPDKVVVNFGEEDILHANFDIDAFMSQYEWLLYQIHSGTSAKICVVSVFSEKPEARLINERLRKLARETGCEFVSLDAAFKDSNRELRVFDLLKQQLRTHPLGFADAMTAVTVL
ncbi:MAG: SGNH/GDSL hydrolase family protein [Oscillospiraceae bacterium]